MLALLTEKRKTEALVGYEVPGTLFGLWVWGLRGLGGLGMGVSECGH